MVFEVPPDWRVGTGPCLHLYSGSYLLLPGSTEIPVGWRLSYMGQFRLGLSSVMSEGSNMTSSSLSSYQKIFSQPILSCQSSIKTTLEPESFSEQLDPPWSLREWGETLLRTCYTISIPACRLEDPLTPCCVLVLAGSTKARELMDYI